jgi:predicted NUDIX family NTP pyrophosphohydrolase
MRYHRRGKIAVAKTSAGMILFRVRGEQLEVLLVHPGGPFWKKKDAGAWFVPKGEVEAGEEILDAAKREFEEETGISPDGEFLALGGVKQKSGKTIFAWAFEGDCDPAAVKSNMFKIEWPPKSGRQAEFPEIDRADFFTVPQAKIKMHPVEFPFVERLHEILRAKGVLCGSA